MLELIWGLKENVLIHGPGHGLEQTRSRNFKLFRLGLYEGRYPLYEYRHAWVSLSFESSVWGLCFTCRIMGPYS